MPIPDDARRSPRPAGEVAALCASLGEPVLLRAPDSPGRVAEVGALLAASYADDNASMHATIREALATAHGSRGEDPLSGAPQAWLLVAADGRTLATLLWRWRPAWRGVEALFSTTVPEFRRLGLGEQLGRALLRWAATEAGATGAAVSCVGYERGAPTSYGKRYWSKLGLTLLPQRHPLQAALAASMMTFPDTRIHYTPL